MIVTSPPRRRAAPLNAQALAAALFATSLLPAVGAFAQGFNPYTSFTDSGPVTPEEKARREQQRTELYDRLSPEYRLDSALVRP